MTEALDKQDQESFKEIDARLQQLCVEQIPTQLQFELCRDDIQEGIKDKAKDEVEDLDVPVEAEEAVLCPLCGLHFNSKTALYNHKSKVHQMSPTICNVCGKSVVQSNCKTVIFQLLNLFLSIINCKGNYNKMFYIYLCTKDISFQMINFT